MTCRDVREVADSFLSGELLTETNHEILRHLDTCPSCRAEMDARRRLRGALQDAFARAPELQPRAEFTSALRERLRDTPAHDRRRWMWSRSWLALAAGLLIVAAVAGILLLNRPLTPADALARDAIGDHQTCALTPHPGQRGVPLEEAAQKIDSTYRLLLTAPPDDVATPDGAAHVLDRHACAFGTRRFAHIMLQYRGRVVSLLMTANDASAVADAMPHLIGLPADGLSVVSVNGAHHAFLVVGDLDSAALTELSRAVTVPLARRLDARLFTPELLFRSALQRISFFHCCTSVTGPSRPVGEL
jgi:hypothetical protein